MIMTNTDKLGLHQPEFLSTWFLSSIEYGHRLGVYSHDYTHWTAITNPYNLLTQQIFDITFMV